MRLLSHGIRVVVGVYSEMILSACNMMAALNLLHILTLLPLALAVTNVTVPSSNGNTT